MYDDVDEREVALSGDLPVVLDLGTPHPADQGASDLASHGVVDEDMHPMEGGGNTSRRQLNGDQDGSDVVDTESLGSVDGLNEEKHDKLLSHNENNALATRNSLTPSHPTPDPW